MVEIAIALALVVVGLLLLAIANYFNLSLGETSKVSILLAPLLVYLIAGGTITEFEGMGWKAKFQKIAGEPIIVAARASDLAISSDEANQPDFFVEALWGHCRPYYVLTESSAKSREGNLDPQSSIRIAIAIRTSIVCGRFLALVVVDDRRRPVGFFERSQFFELLRIPLVTYGNEIPEPNKLFKEVEASELGVILRHPTIRAQSEEAHKVSVRNDADLKTAYQTLQDAKIDLATIVDRHGRFDGLITRAAIEARVIGKIIADH